MRHGRTKIHLYWFTTKHRSCEKTACGKWMPRDTITQVIDKVTCKTCRATVYGRPERTP